MNKIKIDKSWSLFLDRDGVINKRIIDDYVKVVEEFEFLDSTPEVIANLSKKISNVFVVTNQQGIGKGLMTHQDLANVHRYMTDEIEKFGGKIEKVFYAPQLASENHQDRKPGIGMGLKAKTLYPETDFSKSILVGDSVSDIEFGKALGMVTFYISDEAENKCDANYVIKNLKDIINFIAYES
jgi:histidinol-phosphate phosphatase family protein